MNPVMADWLTLIFAPIGVILLVIAFVSARSATKAGKPVATSTKVAQGFGIACVLVVGLLRLFAGN